MLAALGIVLDYGSNTQKFFGGQSSKVPKAVQHDDDILCLALSPDRKLACTGQVGALPKLFVWDTETMAVKSQYKLTKNTRGIISCAFSVDGKYVAFCDNSNDHTLYVIESATGTLKNSQKTGPDAPKGMAWSKKPGDYTVGVVGPKLIKFFKGVEGGEGKRGICGGDVMNWSAITGLPSGEFIAADSTGNLAIFKDNQMTKKVQVHGKPVDALNFVDGKVLSGGNDKKLNILGTDLSVQSTIEFACSIKGCDMMGDKMVVGLKDATIIVVSGSDKKTVMKGHHDGEIWGLDVMGDNIVTSCDDNKVMLWNIPSHTNKSVFTINEKAGEKIKYGASSITHMPDNQCSRAVAVCPSLKQLAVACNNGEIHIHSSENPDQMLDMKKDATRWIERMIYSPNGKYLGVGTHDDKVYIYETAANGKYTLKGTCKGNSSYIMALDWTDDSQFIRCNSGAYEYLFYKIPECSQVTDGGTVTRDTHWASNSDKLGWYVSGIYPPGAKGTDINVVERSISEKYVASGDDWGLINIYRYPCRENAKAISLRGHSEHVVRVKFGSNDNYLYSVGGQDKAIMVWKKE
jgi:WD40 repeat protein